MANNNIGLGWRLMASENQALVSDNGTFAFGFTQMENRDSLQVAIWFAQLPGDRTLVWSANRNSPVTKNAILELDDTGNLVLSDGNSTVWSTNTSAVGVESAVLSESGNLILYTSTNRIAWQSFAYPSDTLLPNQPLTGSLELTSSKLPSHGGYYTLKMLQQRTSLSLALTYNLPDDNNSNANYSYWNGPDISNVTGGVVAVLDEAGSFGIVYGESSNGAVYVYKNDNDVDGLSSAANRSSNVRLAVLRRLVLESNGNIRLYRWDNDVNGSRQWVPEWAAVSNPCDIAGICGNGICGLDKSKTNATCKCLPGTSKEENESQCYENSSSVGNCDSKENQNQFKTAMIQQTNYYFSEFSVIANYSDIATVNKCSDACLTDCGCIASVYGLSEEKPYCWVLRSLDFGGFQDPGSTLFVKIRANESSATGKPDSKDSDGDSGKVRAKVVVVPIVVSMTVLVGLLCLLLYYNVHKKRHLKRAMQNSLIFSGALINFSYRELQFSTTSFSQLLGTGGFGSVYKGTLTDGTLVAIKKLDRLLPHGEKEFLTEVNTIGSMHHMNLVRLREIVGGRRNLDMSYDAEDFFYPGWAYKELTNGTALKVADRRLEKRVEEEELIRALKVGFWCIQDEVAMRPSMGDVVRMLEGSMDINHPPMPQTVLELVEEGLEQVYRAMKREFITAPSSSFTVDSHPSTRATCSYSTMSPR
ncbi:hypothetical protein ACFE04_029052 [Oxalis oulophora]